MAYDTTGRLNEREAMRLQNELKKQGIGAKLRELRMYSPVELEDSIGLKASKIAQMAGRENEPTGAPIA